MIVDTSAVVAILSEDDARPYAEAAASAAHVAISALTVYETRIVLGARRDGRRRYPPEHMAEFDELLATWAAEVVAFDRQHARLAHAAYERYGRGFHPAGLNLADCAAYALARLRGEPLLFKGDDFARTDVLRALTGADPNC